MAADETQSGNAANEHVTLASSMAHMLVAQVDELSETMVSRNAEIERLRRALHNVMDELGVPQPGYLQPVANAYEIARTALEADSYA